MTLMQKQVERSLPFAGYLLPVQYETGVIKEHMAVRTQAGLFDVSHMGEILCEGKDALVNLQHIPYKRFYKYGGRRTGKIQSDV